MTSHPPHFLSNDCKDAVSTATSQRFFQADNDQAIEPTEEGYSLGPASLLILDNSTFILTQNQRTEV